MVEAVGPGVTAPEARRPGHRLDHLRRHGREAGRSKPASASSCRTVMPFDEASALVLTYGTSIYALKDRAQLKAGETLLVLGAAGGVGISAVELGKAYGARVIAAVSSRGQAGLRQEARRRRRRRLSAGALRQGRSQGACRHLQEGVRRDRRRRHLRSRGRRLFGSRAARHRLGGPIPGGRLPGRHRQAAAQPDAAQILPGRGRVLGRVHPARSQGQRGQHRRADAALRQGRDQAGRLRALSRWPGPARRSPGWPRARPWARSS